jgi:invasin B
MTNISNYGQSINFQTPGYDGQQTQVEASKSSTVRSLNDGAKIWDGLSVLSASNFQETIIDGVDSNTPKIPVPRDPDARQPLNANEQRVVKHEYITGLENAVKEKQEQLGLSDESVKALKAALNLPGSDPRDLDKLPAFVRKETVLSLAEAINNKVYNEVATKYGLPNSWSFTATDQASWTPIKSLLPGTIDGKVADSLFRQAGIKAAEDSLDQLKDIGEKINRKLPDGELKNTMLSFLATISTAIQTLKRELQNQEVKDSENKVKFQQATADALKEKERANEAQLKESEKAMKKQEDMSKFGLAMKIVGPILAALGTAAGVALTVLGIFTFGASAVVGVALIAASLAVGAAGIAYSIVDSCTGCTAKAVELFNQVFDAMMPDSPQWAKDLVKALVVTVAATALIGILILALISGAGSGAAASAASQFATTVVREVVKQLSLQLLLMLVLSTNVYPKLVASSLKAMGAKPETVQGFEITAMILQTVAIMGVAATAAASAGRGIADGVKGAATGIKNAALAIKDAAAATAATIKEAVSNPKVFAQTLLQSVQQGIQQALETVKKAVVNLPAKIANEIKSQVEAFAESVKQLFSKDGGLKEVGIKWLKVLCEAGMTLPQAGQVVGGIVQGAIHLALAQILKNQGEIQEAQATLKAMIAMLKKIMDKIMEAIQGTGDFVAALGDFLKNVVNSMSKSVGQIAHSIAA